MLGAAKEKACKVLYSSPLFGASAPLPAAGYGVRFDRNRKLNWITYRHMWQLSTEVTYVRPVEDSNPPKPIKKRSLFFLSTRSEILLFCFSTPVCHRKDMEKENPSTVIFPSLINDSYPSRLRCKPSVSSHRNGLNIKLP